MTINSIPYFYLIEHNLTGKRYAGAKWGANANPETFFVDYFTSSNIVKSIISAEGPAAFSIIELVTDFGSFASAYEYETEFLKSNDCAHDLNYFNGHNNELFSFGTSEYEDYMMKNYGVKHVSQLESSNINRRETNTKKYGSTHLYGSEYFKQKSKETVLKKYGVENVSQADEVKRKKEETFMKNFGAKCNMGTDKFKAEVKETVLKKYGVENVSQLDSVKRKKEETSLKKFGTTHWTKTDEGRKRMSDRVKGVPKPKIACKYCGMMVSKGLLNRWHNENCKQKPVS